MKWLRALVPCVWWCAPHMAMAISHRMLGCSGAAFLHRIWRARNSAICASASLEWEIVAMQTPSVKQPRRSRGRAPFGDGYWR
eukprot:s2538_g8.t1